MEIPLLITSAVHVAAPFVELREADRRITLTLDAIREWIRIDKNLEIVICDGSGFDFQAKVNVLFPNTKIECLNFLNNKDLTSTHGKGFGEGEIVNHAILHSQIINQSAYFAKCTSKLWIENFKECINGFNGVFSCEKAFIGRSLKNYTLCDTRFYITEKIFFQKNLADCYKKVDDHRGYYLEYAYADALREINPRHILFKNKPLVFGFSGSTGLYCHSQTDRFRSVLLRRIRCILGA